MFERAKTDHALDRTATVGRHTFSLHLGILNVTIFHQDVNNTDWKLRFNFYLANFQ
jgi:hypothetical protein